MSKPVEYWDTMLPTIPHVAHLFQGDAAELPRLLFQTSERASGIVVPTAAFDLVQSARFRVQEMASNPIALQFLAMIVRLAAPKRILEIGTFIGVSAMTLARAQPAGGSVTTVEKFDEFAAIARQNFARNGLADRITLLDGDAFDIIAAIRAQGPFDLIFVDGNKERYKDYFEKLEDMLNPNGMFVIDDCFFHGDVFNQPPQTEKGKGVRAFVDVAATRADFDRVLLPLSNGLMLMRRKG